MIAETALTVALLILAGLLLQTYVRLQRVDLGFSPDRVLAASVSLPGERYPDEAGRARFYDRVRAEIARLPGVETVAASSDLPLEGTSCSVVVTGGQDLDLPEPRRLACHPITVGYLETLRVPLLAGRPLEDRDYQEQVTAVLVNQGMAEDLWPGKDPIGRTLRFGTGETVEVVGLVGDLRHGPIHREPWPMIYLPSFWNNMSILVRSAVTPSEDLVAEIRRSVWRVDPRQPVYRTTALTEVVSDANAGRRSGAYLGLLVGLCVLGIGGIGLFSVESYRVSRQLRSVAIRMAMGAGPRRLLRWLLGDVLVATLIGCGLGLVAASLLARVAASFLHGVSWFSPWVLTAALLLTLGTAMAASYGPSRRALELDPAELLHADTGRLPTQ